MPEWVGYFLAATSSLILGLAGFTANTLIRVKERQAEQITETAILRRDVDSLTHRVNSLHDWRNIQQRQELDKVVEELKAYKERHGEL